MAEHGYGERSLRRRGDGNRKLCTTMLGELDLYLDTDKQDKDKDKR